MLLKKGGNIMIYIKYDGTRFGTTELKSLCNVVTDIYATEHESEVEAGLLAQEMTRDLLLSSIYAFECKDCGKYAVESREFIKWFDAKDIERPKRCKKCREARKVGNVEAKIEENGGSVYSNNGMRVSAIREKEYVVRNTARFDKQKNTENTAPKEGTEQKQAEYYGNDFCHINNKIKHKEIGDKLAAINKKLFLVDKSKCSEEVQELLISMNEVLSDILSV